MKYLKIPLLCLIALSAAGCAFQKPLTGKVTVDKAQSGLTVDHYALFYSLPRTVLDISVVVDKTITRPGPFAAYAERFLGIPGVVNAESVEYAIVEVKAASHPEKDPDQTYLLKTHGHAYGARVSLTADGIIRGVNIPINTDLTISQVTVADLREAKFDNPEYPELTLRKNFEPVPDTIFRIVRTDTSFYRLPLIRKVEGQKTLLAQAEEAASVLMKIRSSRFAILNGDIFDSLDSPVAFPEGSSLEVILRELGLLEQDYMSLFTGRSQTTRETHHFTYTPLGADLSEESTLCYFSRLYGISEERAGNGEPVTISLSRSVLNRAEPIRFDEGTDKAPREKGLAYRIPEQARVEVNRLGQNLFAREMLIAQCGTVGFIPPGVLADDKTAIEFYPAYGSIKNIFRR
ncbi:MAG: DUF4831 family protein [Bacteroidales bacterium]